MKKVKWVKKNKSTTPNVSEPETQYDNGRKPFGETLSRLVRVAPPKADSDPEK